MVSVSVCMIVKNEEAVLQRCLDCVKQFADEIVIVDTGSDDATKQIAQRYTDKVYDFSWCEDFAKARNFAFSKGSSDFLMWLDADDVILKEDIKSIQQLKQRLSLDTTIVMMKYHTAFDEIGQPVFTYYRERLINRKANLAWEGVIHEVIPLQGTIQYEDIAITHQKLHVADPDRNLKIFEHLKQEGKLFSPREQFYYARELYYHERYEEAIHAFEAFLAEDKGWIENAIDACELLGNCYQALHDQKQQLSCYLRSFQYDVPRGELCYAIGNVFYAWEHYPQAIYWYECAMACPINETSGAFIRKDCYGYLPALQLCVCWWQMQDKEKAKAYNELAGSFKETDTVKNNRSFFENAL